MAGLLFLYQFRGESPAMRAGSQSEFSAARLANSAGVRFGVPGEGDSRCILAATLRYELEPRAGTRTNVR